MKQIFNSDSISSIRKNASRSTLSPGCLQKLIQQRISNIHWNNQSISRSATILIAVVVVASIFAPAQLSVIVARIKICSISTNEFPPPRTRSWNNIKKEKRKTCRARTTRWSTASEGRNERFASGSYKAIQIKMGKVLPRTMSLSTTVSHRETWMRIVFDAWLHAAFGLIPSSLINSLLFVKCIYARTDDSAQVKNYGGVSKWSFFVKSQI